MRLPELTPQNYEEVYDFFEQFRANKILQKLGFAAMKMAYGSEVHFLGSADYRISRHLAENGRIIVAPNHQHFMDTPTIGGLSGHPIFSGLDGHTTAPGKAEMFDWPVLGRYMFPHLLIHPTFRRPDYEGLEDADGLRRKVNERIIGLNINFINRGGSVAMFPEGTRNQGDPRQIQKIGEGIAHIALGVDNPGEVMIVPMGIAYKKPHKKLPRQPLVVVNEPFCVAGEETADILDLTHDRVQEATKLAFVLAA